MPEILTESFCERCGTRYTFEAVAPKARPLTKLKVLSKGLKNYVLSDETTLDEAFADARNDEQRAVSSQQLDAFHKTFNFCMTCRQYTCGNCWNEAEGRCLTCAPHLGEEVLPGPFPTVDLVAAAPAGANGNGHPEGSDERIIEASAWPVVDLRPATPEAADVADLADLAETMPEGGAASTEAAGPETPAAAIPAAETASAPDAADGSIAAAASSADTGPADGSIAAAALGAAAAATPGRMDAPGAPVLSEAPATLSADDHAAAAAAHTTSLFARFRPRRERSDTAPESAPAEGAGSDASFGAASPSEAVSDGPSDALVVGLVAAETVVAAEAGVDAPAAVDVPAEGAQEAVAALAAPGVSGTTAPPTPGAEAETTEDGLTAAELAAVTLATASAVEARRASKGGAQAPAAHAKKDGAEGGASATPVAAPATPEAEAAPEAEAVLATPAIPQVTPEAEAVPAVPAETTAPIPEVAPAAPPAPAAASDDVVETPTWRIVAPDTADGVPAPAISPVAPPASVPGQPQWPVQQGEPQWPVQQGEPQWPGAAEWSSTPAPWARPATGAPSSPAAFAPPVEPPVENLWAASSRDVLNRPGSGVQACVSCGLPLSATARFCRRCGTRQG